MTAKSVAEVGTGDRAPSIRNAVVGEAGTLEALQRRSSDVWEEYRAALAANPDAIELPQSFIESGWVRVAVDDNGTSGFHRVDSAQTRFGPAVRMRRELQH